MGLRHGNLKLVSFWATVCVAALAAGAFVLYWKSDTRAYSLASEAEAHLEAGRPLEARFALWSAVGIRDDIPAFHLMLGRANFQVEQLGAAFASYSFANALEPENVEALIAIGQIGLQIGEIEKSKEATRALLLMDPNQTEGLIVQGVHNMLGGRYGAAIANADRILGTNPAHEQAVILKIRATLLDGRQDDTVRLLETYTVPDTDSPGLAMTELEVRRELGQPTEMLAVFDKLRTLLPDNITVKLDEANLLFKLEQPRQATQLVMETLRRDDLDAREISELIRILRFYADPLEVASKASLVASQGTPDARVELARYLTAQKQYRAAASLADGLPGLALRELSALDHMVRGEPGKASAIATDLLEEDTTDCFVRYVDASSRLAAGQAREAIYSGQIATSECPTFIEAWEVLGQAYASLGSNEQARRVFRQGLAANPQEPALAEHYVEWLLEQDRSREARAVRRKLALNMPGYSPAWRGYLELCEATDAACVPTAQRGLERSLVTYGIDPPPGERATSGLFGRFLIR